MKCLEEFLHALADADPGVRDRAAEELGKLAHPRAVDPLLHALSDEYWRVRDSAAWALGEIGDPRAGDALLALLDDPAGDVQQTVRHALTKLRDTRLIPRLIQELSHQEEWVRFESALLLAEIGDRSAIAPLEILAHTHTNVRRDVDVRKTAREAAERIRSRYEGTHRR